MLVFVEGVKPENPEKNPRSKDENQEQSQPTYDAERESNPGHIGGRQVLSPLRHPCSPELAYLYSTVFLQGVELNVFFVVFRVSG